ncbi:MULTISPECIES: EAL domain-containing protein [unclassified Marinobacter]|uniref:sensor domain-containing phosphodiesterase n=1 Tax=unclassified Marinobacter TaxID=83889 RepID=UPI000BF56E38|nr:MULTISPECIES: EAL domain-containing protein [unclassified Marinobacter]PFG10475.1 diguanylate cyclase/phosphodiesterase with GAF sensor [Marinobacter sp. LV10MA510-1]PFG52397.1 diguanylate cyclase/phosphodiesterase with GAF sensor [Marinobacter sp. LV10R520-4]
MDPVTLEKRRLAALERLTIMDTGSEERFDRLINLARRFYSTPIALFSLLDEKRQWFKSKRGLDVSETPRCVAFCDHAIKQDSVFVVPDATKDERFCSNPLVTGEPHVRFYAGMPVREPGGFKMGTLCIMDRKPRDIPEHELDVLRTLASLIEDEVERFYHASQYQKQVPVSRLNRAIHRAQNTFHTDDDQDAAFEILLSDLLVLTDSQFGFIGEMLTNSDNSPYLRVGAITDISWSPESADRSQQRKTRGLLFERLNSLIDTSMLSDDVLISDGFESDSQAGELPTGHPQITRYMGVPIFSGDNRVGLVGLANRPEGYTNKLATELEPLLQTVGQLIERKRMYKERQEHQKGLEQAANFDPLTGLPNRRRLTELFEQELTLADQRQGALSICFIDLDCFKEINDNYGHSVGDAVLKTVAARLQHVLRECDIIARLGGDEFVAIIRDVENNAVYERMLEAIRRPINHQDVTLDLAASMGVTLYPRDQSAPDLLLRHADQAMYAAKDAGRNRYSIFDVETYVSRVEQVRVLEQTAKALGESQFEMYLQPKIVLVNHRVDGFEALIRWNHPEKGLLGPISFLPQLEHTEYAAAVGRFVITDAVAKLQQWKQLGLPYSLSINLSPTHLLSDGFVEDLQAALQDCDPDVRSRLIIELLETTALNDPGRIMGILLKCRDLGVQVSLDDFGTGYSSLDHFRRLPAQEIKIDRSFVSDMLNNADDEMIVKSIISLSKNFKRRVVAEGIEAQAMQDKLIEMGCEQAQGFFYSKPLPAIAALAWAEAYQKR